MEEGGHTSVVLHVDLDCFYAAVEQVRLGIPKEQPLAVQQWEGLIAVNYPARAAGIVRHERMSDALQKCPDLHLVHVETIGGSGKPGTAESVGPRGNAKVSLERYRQASAKVFTIFQRFSELCERASIDEAYLDVSEQVEDMLQKDIDWDGELQRLLEPAGPEGALKNVPVMLIEGGSLATFNAYDRRFRYTAWGALGYEYVLSILIIRPRVDSVFGQDRLLAGAIIADRVRASVRNELSYTCSVGIASNKLLAKIASAKNKPDRQTLIPPRAVPGLMQDLPLKKIKLLGGKLGEEMKNRWGCATAGEAQHIPQPALIACFGDRLGTYVWKAVRGLKAEKVQVKNLVKSMLAAKSFSATNDLSAVRQWLAVLAQELAIRMRRDFEQNQRQPKLFQVYYRSGLFKKSADHSKSVAMPISALQILLRPPSKDEDENAKEHEAQEEENSRSVEAEPEGDGDELINGNGNEASMQGVPSTSSHLEGCITETTRELAKVLEDTAFRVFESLEGAFPCTRLALAASSFQDLPSQGAKSIQHFFTSSINRQNPPLQPDNSECHTAAASSPLITPSSSEKPAEKPTGILKYLNSNTGLHGNNAHCALDTSTSEVEPTLSSSATPPLVMESESSLHTSNTDVSVDLGLVNIDEQRRILHGIHQSKQTKKAHSSTKPPMKPHGKSTKRAREVSTNVPHPKQSSIGSFFRACEKP